MSYLELTTEKFLQELASEQPVPGGGGAAAVAGGLAAALASMVANLTKGKEKFAEHEEELQRLLQRCEELRCELLGSADRDAEAFQNFMSCFRLPRATDAEIQKRRAAVEAAAKRAAEVPMDIAAKCLAVLKIAGRLVVIGNPSVVTDGACSALLARAALQCAVYNVMVNMKFTGDETYNNETLRRLQKLEQEALLLEDRALEYSDALLK